RSSTQRPERIFLPGEKNAIPLDPRQLVTRYLQRIRDETHRFVIQFHRKRRSKRVVQSALSDIPGIGPERRLRLIKHFGDINAILKGSEEEVARVGRMPKTLAQKLLKVLQERMIRR